MKHFKSDKFLIISIVIVLLFSLFWRFANYSERWTLSQDQARDGIIGLYSVQNHILPLVGPPSSAGNFSFGPYYYWIITLFTILIPSVNGPWIGFTLLSVMTPLLFFYIGNYYGKKISGILFGLLAAFSSELIFHSVDMLNPIPISFLVALLFLLIIKMVDQGKVLFSMLIGFIIGMAINFHFQSLGLLIIIPAISYFNSLTVIQKTKVFLLSLLGLIVSFIPLIVFNANHHNILFHNIISFFTTNKNTAGTSHNLITDIVLFWPQLWGTTISHIPLLGYAFLLLFMIAAVFALGENGKKNVTKSFYVFGITFLFQIMFLFIYQGIRSPIYLIVFHSFFIFFTGWIVLNFYQLNRYAGLGLFILLLAVSVPANLFIVLNNGSQVSKIMTLKNTIARTSGSVLLFSDESSRMLSLPLYYLFAKENELSPTGKEVVLCENKLIKDSDGFSEKWSCPMDIETIAEDGTYKVFEKKLLSDDQQKQFKEVTSLEIYHFLTDNYPGNK